VLGALYVRKASGYSFLPLVQLALGHKKHWQWPTREQGCCYYAERELKAPHAGIVNQPSIRLQPADGCTLY